MKIWLLFIVMICIKSCFGLLFFSTPPEPSKESEIIYYNLSNDIIKKIEIKLLKERSGGTKDIIILNREVNKGDSLVFKYNTENFFSTALATELFTTVFFLKQDPILNNVHKKGYVSGYIGGSNKTVYKVYIGNKNLVVCVLPKSQFPNNEIVKNAKCELDSLL